MARGDDAAENDGPGRLRQLPGHLAAAHRAARRHRVVAAATGLCAIAAMAVASTLGNIHGPHLNQRLIAFVGAFLFLVLSVVAIQHVAASLAALVTAGASASSGNAVKILVSFFGYVIVLFVGLGLLAVPVEHLLIGGALTGIIVGIAAQQSLGNVFAGFVLLLARPFTLGQRVRVRSGSLGGILDGTVTSMSLAYVTIETADGAVNVPNAALLGAGVGPAPPEAAPAEGDAA
ncbi:MAG TPA: mechanosensitive ion channel family protein [Acidimicrobiales bacterium]|nr:mechanosensitive ion channel family protein [Acidimicrobiales bacterium]